MAVDRDAAAARRDRPGNAAEHGRLAGPIGPAERDALPRRNREVERAHDLVRAEPSGQVLSDKHGWYLASCLVLDPKVFKAYDVRGIYPDELDEAGAHAIGRAYVEEFEPRRIAVGRDMRLSAPAMSDAVMRGAGEAGADVLDLGMVGTEMVYFAVGELGLDGGIAVTASHNPKEYTGMKIVRRGALPVGGDSGLFDIRTRAMGDEKGRVPERGLSLGRREQYDIWPAYVDRVLSFV